MFFRLTNLPPTFQRMMNQIFGDLIAQGVLEIYLNDLLLYTKMLEEHQEVTAEVLRRLKENKLYLRLSKCVFEQKEVEFLGVIISKKSVHIDPVKTEAIDSWRTPKNNKEVKSFTVFCNFYQDFIADFLTIAKPLHALSKKDKIFEWTEECKRMFQLLKSRI